MKTMLAMVFVLQGCAVQAVGVWVQNDEPSKSFAFSWHRDKDPKHRTPDPAKEVRVGIPTWLKP